MDQVHKGEGFCLNPMSMFKTKLYINIYLIYAAMCD